MVLSACVITRLPFPYPSFEQLSEKYTFYRIVAQGSARKEKKYSYLLFSCLPVGRIYSERCISGVNVEALLEKLSLRDDFISTDVNGECFGSVYLQIESGQISSLIG